MKEIQHIVQGKKREPRTKLLSLIYEFNRPAPDQAIGIFEDVQFSKKGKLLVKLSTRLKISWEAAGVFAFIFSHYLEDGEVHLRDISKALQIRLPEYDRLQNCIKELTEKGLVLTSTFMRSKPSYFIGSDIQRSILNNKPVTLRNLQCDTFGLAEHIESHFKRFGDENIELNLLIFYLKQLIEVNPQLPVSKVINDLKLPDEELLVLMGLFCCTIDGNLFQLNYFLSNVFKSPSKRMMIKKRFQFGYAKLMLQGFIKTNDGQYKVGDNLVFTKMGLEKIFGSDTALLPEVEVHSELAGTISCNDIQERKLFYNPVDELEMQRLFSLLQEDKFNAIQSQLKSKGMPQGFALLLYGPPGTGKTESVLQIAKATKRDLFKIDISTIRDKFVGESEKHTRQIFEEYRQHLKKSALAPIMFINEADALIGRRTSVKDAVDQMNNSMQNILLDELERFEGILFCTTNMETHPDPAFERRFLYKIKLSQPNVNVRAEILKERIPFLSDAQALELSTSFELSGGQVDNIHRKIVTEELLNGAEPGFDFVVQLCAEEKSHAVGGGRRKVIGFGGN